MKSTEGLHSIVVAVYNEYEGILPLVSRLDALVPHIAPDRLEIILVNDGSSDGSDRRLDEVAIHNPIYKIIHLSRNFGHQFAITAGLEWASGETVTIIDADLQDPPEVILQFLAKWREGFEVVFGIRRKREGETLFKLWTAKLFYRTIRRLTHLDIPIDAGDFRLMDRKAVEALVRMPESQRFVRGMVSWLGFRQTGVLYDRAKRAHGETHYPLKKMIKLALDGITSFSTAPLRFTTYLGMTAAIFAMTVSLWALYTHFINGSSVPGWTSVILVVLFLGGMQLVALGIFGEYLGRTYEEVKRRPLYLVGRAVGFERSPINNTNARSEKYESRL